MAVPFKRLCPTPYFMRGSFHRTATRGIPVFLANIPGQNRNYQLA
jgi:hypothetical protein